MLDSIPRKKLGFLPTPAYKLENIGESLNLDNIWIKRDDLIGPGLGGNKVRKLEYVIGAAEAEECDTLVTVGALQSNHCRQTAEVSARSGKRCILLLAGEEPEVYTGNLLISKLAGAEIKFYPEDDFSSVQERMETVLETLVDFGLKPYAIPAGATYPVGCLGYVSAIHELVEQLESTDFMPEIIVHALGTAGTHAGMLIGANTSDIDIDVIGVSAIFDEEEATRRIKNLTERTVDEYKDVFEPFKPKITVDDQFLGEYGVMDSAIKSAIEMFAKMEGIMLDPVYTGRAGVALMRMALAGDVDEDTPILFWHTGGIPALFAHAKEF